MPSKASYSLKSTQENSLRPTQIQMPKCTYKHGHRVISIKKVSETCSKGTIPDWYFTRTTSSQNPCLSSFAKKCQHYISARLLPFFSPPHFHSSFKRSCLFCAITVSLKNVPWYPILGTHPWKHLSIWYFLASSFPFFSVSWSQPGVSRTSRRRRRRRFHQQVLCGTPTL